MDTSGLQLKLEIFADIKAVKRHNDGDWMPYCGCLLVAAFVKIVSFWQTVSLYLYNKLTRPLLKFVYLHIGSNYLCTNLVMGPLALSKWKPIIHLCPC